MSDVFPYNPGYFPQFAGGPIYPGRYRSTGAQLVLGFTHIFTPTLLLEFRAGYSRLANTGQPPKVPANFMDSLGIPGIDGYGQNSQGVAAFTITGADLVGGSGNIPFIKVTDNYQTSYHLTWTHDKQTIKWGYDLFRREMNTVQAGSPSGAFSFTGQFTQNPSAPGGTGSGIADALLGLDASGSLSVWQEVGTRRWEHGLYFQDDYRVTNKLTLNMGVRWELTTPWTEMHNRLANFVPSANTVLPIGSPQVPGNALYTPNWKDFGPRFGLSYSIDPKTVIRAGYGYFFDFTSVSVNTLGTENPPFSGTLAITNNTTATNLPGSITPLSNGFLPYQSFGSFNPAGLSIAWWPQHAPDSSVQQRNVIVAARVAVPDRADCCLRWHTRRAPDRFAQHQPARPRTGRGPRTTPVPDVLNHQQRAAFGRFVLQRPAGNSRAPLRRGSGIPRRLLLVALYRYHQHPGSWQSAESALLHLRPGSVRFRYPAQPGRQREL